MRVFVEVWVVDGDGIDSGLDIVRYRLSVSVHSFVWFYFLRGTHLRVSAGNAQRVLPVRRSGSFLRPDQEDLFNDVRRS